MQMQTIVLDDAGRLGLIDMVIGNLTASGDPRAPEAIVEYQRQRAVIVERMKSEVRSQKSEVGGQPGPMAQVVGMETVELRGN